MNRHRPASKNRTLYKAIQSLPQINNSPWQAASDTLSPCQHIKTVQVCLEPRTPLRLSLSRSKNRIRGLDRVVQITVRLRLRSQDVKSRFPGYIKIKSKQEKSRIWNQDWASQIRRSSNSKPSCLSVSEASMSMRTMFCSKARTSPCSCRLVAIVAASTEVCQKTAASGKWWSYAELWKSI